MFFNIIQMNHFESHFHINEPLRVEISLDVEILRTKEEEAEEGRGKIFNRKVAQVGYYFRMKKTSSSRNLMPKFIKLLQNDRSEGRGGKGRGRNIVSENKINSLGYDFLMKKHRLVQI